MIMYSLKYQDKFIMRNGCMLLIPDKNNAVHIAQEYAKANDLSGVQVVRLHFTVHSENVVVLVE